MVSKLQHETKRVTFDFDYIGTNQNDKREMFDFIGTIQDDKKRNYEKQNNKINIFWRLNIFKLKLKLFPRCSLQNKNQVRLQIAINKRTIRVTHNKGCSCTTILNYFKPCQNSTQVTQPIIAFQDEHQKGYLFPKLSFC